MRILSVNNTMPKNISFKSLKTDIGNDTQFLTFDEQVKSYRQKQLADVAKALKDNNFKIQRMRQWDLNVLHAFVMSPVLQEISKTVPVKANYNSVDNGFVSGATLNIGFADKKYSIHSHGDSLGCVNADIVDHLVYNIKDKDSFLEMVDEQMRTEKEEAQRIAYIIENDYKILEENLVNLKNKEKVPYILLYKLATTKAILDTSKENGGMDVELKYNPYNNVSQLKFKFSNKTFKLYAAGYSELSSKTDVAMRLDNYIHPKYGKEIFQKDVESYMKENKNKLFWK